MEHRFDRLATSVSGAISRREALRRFGSGLGVSVLAFLGVAALDNDRECKDLCKTCCRDNVPIPRGQNDLRLGECMSQCRSGEGICGPAFIFSGCTPR